VARRARAAWGSLTGSRGAVEPHGGAARREPCEAGRLPPAKGGSCVMPRGTTQGRTAKLPKVGGVVRHGSGAAPLCFARRTGRYGSGAVPQAAWLCTAPSCMRRGIVGLVAVRWGCAAAPVLKKGPRWSVAKASEAPVLKERVPN
jgi:hypothetical protein